MRMSGEEVDVALSSVVMGTAIVGGGEESSGDVGCCVDWRFFFLGRGGLWRF